MFVPVRVINLERHRERRRNTEKQLNLMGVSYEVTSAVDGDSLTQTQVDEVYNEAATIKPLTRGEIGLAMSHINIYREIVRKNHAITLILEDDDHFIRSLKPMLEASKHFPDGWDIVLLRYIFGKKTQLDPVPDHFPLNGYRLKRPRLGREIWGTYAYFISKIGAEKLISQTRTLSKPIDHYTGDHKAMDIYVVFPKMAIQEDRFPSTLKKTRRIARGLAESIPMRRKVIIFFTTIFCLHGPSGKVQFYFYFAIYKFCAQMRKLRKMVSFGGTP